MDKLDGKALIKFSRVQGNQPLYGTPINVGGFVMLTIDTAEDSEDWGEKRYMGKKNLITVNMSFTQFASAITQMNYGVGFPATLEYFNGEKVNYLGDKDDQIDVAKRKAIELFERATPNPSKEKIVDLVNSTRMSKDKKEQILNAIEPFILHAKSNREFALELFDDLLEKKISAAKSEIQGKVEMMIMETGLKALENKTEEIDG